MVALSAILPSHWDDGVWFRQEVSLPARARRAAAALAQRIGMDPDRVGQVELAVTEVAVNLNQHAADGALLLRLLAVDGSPAVELVAVDSGPGMPNVRRSMADGTSTAGTLGLGLGIVDRMADGFDVCSLPGRGTVLVARFRAGRAVPAGEPTAVGLTRPISGESVCGDNWAVRLVAPADGGGDGDGDSDAFLVMLCDGLGHGPLAALASTEAAAAFHRASGRPSDLVGAMHIAMTGTRGGAVGVARVDPRARLVEYCGVGNISAFVVAGESRSALLSTPGIVGHHMPSRIRSSEQALPPGSTLVLHSDGLTERWNPASLPGLFSRSAAVVAGQLLREAGVRRDDASVLAARGAW